MGFGTSSSAATMPVTMECGERYGSRKSIVKFVIPLGTNVNRDGAALYEAASVMFLAQVPPSPPLSPFSAFLLRFQVLFLECMCWVGQPERLRKIA